MLTRQKPDPLILVLFGASGDLAKRKLISAIYNLSREDLLPDNFLLVGISRRLPSRESFQLWMRDGTEKYGWLEDEDHWSSFEERLYHLQADIYTESSFHKLRSLLEELNAKHQCGGNLLFYFATAPSNYADLIKMLGKYELNKGLDGGWSRVIVEKPFGLDLDSSLDLNKQFRHVLDESQIYRIDHYTGKEAIQNLLVFRFANRMFSPTWNRKYVDHIQITVSETVGVDKRGDYFEQTGALRDMIQSHLLQILAFLTMERPNSLDPDEIRDKKVELLRSIKRVHPAKVNDVTVRGQYGAGRVTTPRSGDHFVVAYRSENQVDPHSMVETYAALKLEIDNDRWMGVPIYLRTGKRLKKRLTEVVIEFRPERFGIFREKETPMEPNRLILRIQPNPSINLTVGWKPPGLLSDVSPLTLDFEGRPEWQVEPFAYERLLLDAMHGDKTLFLRFDEVEEQWRVVMPILEGWAKYPPKENFPNYPAGSQGPELANQFIEEDGRSWRTIN